ncbi:MAG: apolipoprotein N-acyltransferase [Glaciecola sp.]|jgi:apolipoprotein N-acyltransferase
MPPWGLWPATFAVVPVLGAALVLAQARGVRAFALGTTTGTVAFLGIITWARNIEPGGGLAWPILSLIEGLYVGLFALLIAPLLTRRWVAMPALGFGWVGLEVVRSNFPEHGFGWAQFAYAHVDGSWLKPLARLGGSYLLTLAVALFGAVLFESWRQGHDAVEGLPGTRRARALAMLPHTQPPLFWIAGLLLVTVLATIEPPATQGTTDILVIQGNDRENPVLLGAALDLAIAQDHLAITRDAIDAGGVPDVLVWPESSVDHDPFAPGGQEILAVLQEAAALARGGLVVGIRREGDDAGTFRNTVSLVAQDGTLTATYDKRQLVPFGEYVPGRALLGKIGPLNAVASDGIPGTSPTHLQVATGQGPVDLAIAICFETLFGHTVRDNVIGEPGDSLAGIIIASTNDASFGRGSQPAQHIAQSQLRAIETGRWVVHAAISGTSALIDPDGNVTERTELFTHATIRADVPVAVGSTPYLSTGDIAGKSGLLALMLILVLRSRVVIEERRAARDDHA